MRSYYLEGTNNKGFVLHTDNGEKILFSYGTPIIKYDQDGNLIRLYGGWSQTTGRHIKAFCGLNKQQFLALEIEE